MVTTSPGVQIYGAKGQFEPTVIARTGLHYLSRCFNYQPFGFSLSVVEQLSE